MSLSSMDALFNLQKDIPTNIKELFPKKYALKKTIETNLSDSYEEVDKQFWQNHPIDKVVAQRAAITDRTIQLAWQWHKLNLFEDIAMLAIGGYGANHLHPHSDIDTLIIVPDHKQQKLNYVMERFITFLWDIGFNIATSVLTLEECKELVKTEDSSFTSILTIRLIAGSSSIHHQLKQMPYENTQDIWPFDRYYQAKIKERNQRVQRFLNSEYNQEPNIKESPGALRDIDFIEWLANRCYGPNGIRVLCQNHDFTEYELDILQNNKLAFWRLRYALHLIAQKPNDRLFLEYQTEMAKRLEWPGKNLNEAVANMMQQYFAMASQTKSISDIIAQRFQEILFPIAPNAYHVLSPHCQLAGNFLDITQIEWYKNKPEEFISLFVTLANTYAIEGFTARTNQALYEYFNSLPIGTFLNMPLARKYFLELFQFPYKLSDVFNIMNRLGVLSQFIPAYTKLVGQMQFDLNHIYTVDAHTLLVMKYVQDFYLHKDQVDLPFLETCQDICDDPLILYCAAFFHDIGKGHGGNHSEIGEKIAQEFCQQFQLSDKQSTLITWLVLNHLALSHFAQRKDLSDDNVILEFANFVASKEKLCYLYLLTAADIQGTNIKLYNSWRKALLRDLFDKTLQVLNLAELPTQTSKISTRKSNAIAQLLEKGLPQAAVETFWDSFDINYFRITNTHYLVWHALEILKPENTPPIVLLRPHWNKAGTDIFLYSKDCYGLFAKICRTLEKLMLTIAEAKISMTKEEFGLYTLVVLESSGQPITGPQRLMNIKNSLLKLLSSIPKNQKSILTLPYYSRHVPRWYKYYEPNAKIDVYQASGSKYTTIEVQAPDFPGLLARIGKVLVQHDLSIHSAKVNTLGDKVIDFFYVSSKQADVDLADKKYINKLKEAILQVLR